MSEYIGPQVYPGGWKVISREEAKLLASLGIQTYGWTMGNLDPSGTEEQLWWRAWAWGHSIRVDPWPMRSNIYTGKAMYFIKEEDVDD